MVEGLHATSALSPLCSVSRRATVISPIIPPLLQTASSNPSMRASQARLFADRTACTSFAIGTEQGSATTSLPALIRSWFGVMQLQRQQAKSQLGGYLRCLNDVVQAPPNSQVGLQTTSHREGRKGQSSQQAPESDPASKSYGRTPSPSTMVMYRSTTRFVKTSTRPLGWGQRISRRSIKVFAATPRTMRGSWLER